MKKGSQGVGVMGLLGIAFIVLKLCGVIDWSWWVVTLPLWGGFAIGCMIVLFVFVFALIKEVKGGDRK